MPKFYRRYNKRYGRRRYKPYSKSKSWMDKKYSVGEVARAAWRGVNYIKGLVNSELYKFDATFSAAPVPDTGLVTHLTAIAQGDGVAARTGNSIFVRSVNIHGVVGYNSASTSANQTIRVAIIMDTQQVGDSAPSLTTVYSASGCFGHMNADTTGRFKILWTRYYNVNADTPTRNVEINVPLRQHVRFNGTASTDIQRNGIYIVASSSQTTANYPTFSGESRVSYHDN